ncbi:unnamed protein product [Arctia plantaginis]|uniref:Uncharacterized protein n=1 Tax=Arctia plantaginis TaxID=874455 RepID=A0A8S0ZPR4_ARCPL|nr:unnamed protein product [Arctia plantaginis]
MPSPRNIRRSCLRRKIPINGCMLILLISAGIMILSLKVPKENQPEYFRAIYITAARLQNALFMFVRDVVRIFADLCTEVRACTSRVDIIQSIEQPNNTFKISTNYF